MSSRREFLQWAGAAVSVAAGSGLASESLASTEPSAEKKAKRTFDLGVATYTFHKLTLDRAIAMTNRVGLKHFCLHPLFIPINSASDQVARTAEKVKAAGLDLYACGVVYMSKPADVDNAFEFAKAAGVRIIVGVPTPDVLPLVNEKVKKYDIRVAIHNHGPGDKVYPLPDTAYEKIKNLDPRVGLCIDIGHTVRMGADPSRAAEQFADRLFDVHIKDVSEATAKGATVEAGRGIIDLPKFLRTLDKIGYSGFTSFEFEKDPNDPLPGLAESVGYVRGAMAAM